MKALRNIAIIAHVDHGKTTLVDKILHQTLIFRKDEEKGNLILDNNDLERERGITIFSKNVAVEYKGFKINVIDTPGHADFGGEVERVLKMADGVLLLVDAFEGPMPQTRFVLNKALELGLKPIVIVNKVDKPNCTPDRVNDAVFDLMFNLNATEWQLDYKTVYGSAKQGWYGPDWKTPSKDISYLLDTILEQIPEPKTEKGDLQMQITSLDYSNYLGRIAVGKIKRGSIKENQPIALINREGIIKKSRIKELYTFEGLGKKKVEQVEAGDICAIVGLEDFQIGDTVADANNPEALSNIMIDEPTMSMLFTINNSPFFGKDGKYVTSRHLRDRLMKETEKNLALKVMDTESPDSLLVFGRGILHLSVLIETMRRESYEIQVGQPKVITKEIDGVKHEPIETLVVDVPEHLSGKIVELATQRKGEMLVMEPRGDMQHLEFVIPSRGLIGLRSQMLTASQGEAIMTHRFSEYQPWKGNIPGRQNGSLVSMETGPATSYSIDKLLDRGIFFVESGEEIYEGQIVGENSRQDDIVVNIVKAKQLTNFRAAGKDDAANKTPKRQFSLEEALEYIKEDELVEITPKAIRLRKIYLKEHERKRNKQAN
ncbi:MAG: translational GTPase TypA [Bacteroidia bacterium]|nr:translational GTPase TypA [Bacteroidia bacterium]MCO5253340.1 translational GTPase TypA [Bacteroidota bacterium]MCZ2130936.1 translational GTPase TypA [Bacteroidia bacterium]